MSIRSNRAPIYVLVAIIALMATVIWFKMQHRPGPSLMDDEVALGDGPGSTGPTELENVAPSTPARRAPLARPMPARINGAQLKQRRAELAKRSKQDFESAQKQFNAQKADPVWAAAQEAKLLAAARSDALAQTGMKASDIAIDCRSSICSISATLDNAIDAQTWVQSYLGSAGRATSVARANFVNNPDGTTTVRIYAAK